MLRRPATKIVLTQEDIAAYDARKAKKDEERREQAYFAARERSGAGNMENGARFGDVTGAPRKETRSREQRIGLNNARVN